MYTVFIGYSRWKRFLPRTNNRLFQILIALFDMPNSIYIYDALIPDNVIQVT